MLEFIMKNIGMIALVFLIVSTIANGIAQFARAEQKKQEARRPLRRPGEGGAGPAALEDEAEGETREGGIGSELREFLDSLRDEAERPAETKPQKRAESTMAPNQEFRRPGEERTTTARPVSKTGWKDYDWESVEDASPMERIGMPIAFPVAMRRVEAPPPTPGARAPGRQFPGVVGRRVESATSPGVPRDDDTPRWLSLSEIIETSPAQTILGVPIEQAIMLREILGPPRARQPWTARGHDPLGPPPA